MSSSSSSSDDDTAADDNDDTISSTRVDGTKPPATGWIPPSLPVRIIKRGEVIPPGMFPTRRAAENIAANTGARVVYYEKEDDCDDDDDMDTSNNPPFSSDDDGTNENEKLE